MSAAPDLEMEKTTAIVESLVGMLALAGRLDDNSMSALIAAPLEPLLELVESGRLGLSDLAAVMTPVICCGMPMCPEYPRCMEPLGATVAQLLHNALEGRVDLRQLAMNLLMLDYMLHGDGTKSFGAAVYALLRLAGNNKAAIDTFVDMLAKAITLDIGLPPETAKKVERFVRDILAARNIVELQTKLLQYMLEGAKRLGGNQTPA